jgi:hypothetical protein
LVGAGVLAAVELDCDAVVGPEAVDGPGAEGFVAKGELYAVFDEQSAEAAFEVALHLAVARGVGFDRGSEVGAAGVAAAQGAEDVFGAGVVVELGFGQGAQEGAVVVADSEVQKGAGDGGAWKTGIEGDVVRAELA